MVAIYIAGSETLVQTKDVSCKQAQNLYSDSKQRKGSYHSLNFFIKSTGEISFYTLFAVCKRRI